MKLIEPQADPSKNHLPHDGTVEYHGPIFTRDEADHWLRLLLANIDWQPDQAVIFGKRIETKRKVAWYADREFSYRYSGTTKTAQLFTDELIEIQQRVEKHCGEKFNSCLLNLYHHGEEGMAWHSDGEKELVKGGAIASLSLGAERKFAFKHKETKERIDLWLEKGSLLVMKGETQSYWLHRLPPTKKVKTPRVNLTFRQMRPG